MLATPARHLPHDQAAWTFEPKWDGIRAIALWDRRTLRLESRNLRDVTVSWPELHPLGDALGLRDVVLDGEIVALDGAGRPSFQLLQERMHVADPASAGRLAALVPVTYLVFDVLHLDGDDLCPRPWEDRRAALVELAVSGPSWATTPSFPGEGDLLWAETRARGWEGVVAKRLGSPYRPGTRSRDWLKVKVVETDEFVVGGWSPGQGRRADHLGALVLGVPATGGGLRHVGQVGTGFTDAELRRLRDLLAARARDTSPFTEGPPVRPGARWVEPELVVEVAYSERTREGILRHPSYKGVRIDKTVADVNTGGPGTGAGDRSGA
jgi:bifunctional non-homologous end joining protein LigD